MRSRIVSLLFLHIIHFVYTLTAVITYFVEDNNATAHTKTFNWERGRLELMKLLIWKKTNERTIMTFTEWEWKRRRSEASKKGKKTKTIKLRIWSALTAYNYTNTFTWIWQYLGFFCFRLSLAVESGAKTTSSYRILPLSLTHSLSLMSEL